MGVDTNDDVDLVFQCAHVGLLAMFRNLVSELGWRRRQDCDESRRRTSTDRLLIRSASRPGSGPATNGQIPTKARPPKRTVSQIRSHERCHQHQASVVTRMLKRYSPPTQTAVLSRGSRPATGTFSPVCAGGWVAPSENEWREKQCVVLAGDAWIADGNHRETTMRGPRTGAVQPCRSSVKIAWRMSLASHWV